MSLSELKPCPFCGGEAEINQIGNEATRKRGYEVRCLTWGCSTAKRAMVIRQPLSKAREFAVERWNARPALLDAARAEQKEDAEPVAWRLDEELTGTSFYDYKPDAEIDLKRFGGTLTPLYAHPPRAEQPVMSREAVLADLEEARDLLMERKYGNPARSPGHNARLVIERAILALASLGGRVEEDMASGGRVQAGPDGPTEGQSSAGDWLDELQNSPLAEAWREVMSHQQPETMIGGYRLVLTCSACPEQYEVFLGKQQVGYLRLRHGEFRADCPDCGDETVYEAEPVGDGIFEPDERARYLTEAVAAIDRWRTRPAENDAPQSEPQASAGSLPPDAPLPSPLTCPWGGGGRDRRR